MNAKIDQKSVQAAPSTTQSTARTRSRLIVPVGRGGKGKSWILRNLFELATANNKPSTVFDADPGNRTLADSLSGRVELLQPVDRSEAARIELLRAIIGSASATPQLFFGDLGGNDQSLSKVTGQSLNEQRKSALSAWGLSDAPVDLFENLDVTVLYPFSNDPHDITQVKYILDSPLANKDIVLVQNEGLVTQIDPGATDPWAAIQATPLYAEAIKKGAKVLRFPAIPTHILLALTETGAPFTRAIRGREPLGKNSKGEDVILTPWEMQTLQTYLADVVLNIREAGLEDKIG